MASTPAPQHAQWMCNELTRRGQTAGTRSILDWGRLGLAPRPECVARSRGTGSTWRYPPGAVNQYAAIASVMRRGRPLAQAVMILLGRGGRPTDDELVFRSFETLFEGLEAVTLDEQTALDFAEEAVLVPASDPIGRKLEAMVRRNVARAHPVDPVTGRHESSEAVARGVAITAFLRGCGLSSPGMEADHELLMGMGLEDLNDDDLADLNRITEAVSVPLVVSRIRELAIEDLVQAAFEGRTIFADLFRRVRLSSDQIDLFLGMFSPVVIHLQHALQTEFVARTPSPS